MTMRLKNIDSKKVSSIKKSSKTKRKNKTKNQLIIRNTITTFACVYVCDSYRTNKTSYKNKEEKFERHVNMIAQSLMVLKGQS